MSNTPTEDDRTDSQRRFADSPVTRREFGRLAAITGGVIALPGNATAAVSSETLAEFYEFVVTHTPDEYAVSTLVRLADETGFDELAAAGIEARTTTDPEPAAYAELTTSATETVADLESVTQLQFTGGTRRMPRPQGSGRKPIADDTNHATMAG